MARAPSWRRTATEPICVGRIEVGPFVLKRFAGEDVVWVTRDTPHPRHGEGSPFRLAKLEECLTQLYEEEYT